MINFNYETDFSLSNEVRLAEWISSVITNEGFKLGEVNYVFCNDNYLHKLNIEFLNHDTLTDIISFDYTMGKIISGDIYISVDRVADNATDFNVDFDTELSRVMVHGILHYCGYMDKTDNDAKLMRSKEDFYMDKLL
ncbi:MAG: rRNA maturation RNase YbeY [Aestuariibaculum sp.]